MTNGASASPPPPPVQIDASGLDALIARAAGGGAVTGGKFTWTPPTAAAAIDVRGTGIGAQLAQRGLITTTTPQPLSLSTVEFGARLSGLDPEQVRKLQEQLYASGAYPASYYGRGAKKIPFGQLDPDTAQILQQMAGLASFTGNLDQLLSAKVDIAELGEKRAPLVIELPSQEDMDSVLRESASEILGRDPTPEELARYSSRFTSAIRSYREKKYGTEETGGTVTQPPSAEALAESFLRETSPVEAGAQRMERGLQSLRELFIGGGGGG
jgi:hypothetical protein